MTDNMEEPERKGGNDYDQGTDWKVNNTYQRASGDGGSSNFKIIKDHKGCSHAPGVSGGI